MKKLAFPPSPNLEPGVGTSSEETKNMDTDKEQQMVKFEIENCKRNIEFYRLQIENMEDKLQELEKLRRAYEYY